ncbi:MAG TPA: ATP-binding protein [Pyrinomonadaceae bacterium]|nr:ATP-binding protein [Pyrinomonadaceae bacterium]
MTLKKKLLILFTALALAPLAVGAFSYYYGLRAVEAVLRDEAGARAAHAVTRAEQLVGQVGRHLLDCSREPHVRAAMEAAAGGRGPDAAGPETVAACRAQLEDFFGSNRRYVDSLAAFSAAGEPLFRVEADSQNGGRPHFQTADFVASERRFDARVLNWEGDSPLRGLAPEHGSTLRLAVPVREEGTGRPLGALFAEVRLTDVFGEADAGLDPAQAAAIRRDGRPGPPPGGRAAAGVMTHPLVVLDNSTQQTLYHTNDALKHQPVASAMPYFREVAERMAAGEEGFAFYEAPGGHRWLAAFRQAQGLPVSLAVSDDYTQVVAPVRRSGLWGLLFALAAGATALGLLIVITNRAGTSVERVARGASAIAAGKLEQRIDLSSGDEMRGLAESFNLMSERLREMIAREAESKQFDSFMRLSAMLTHDLKNAITGLSMLVSNMERQYHREEFRADAIASLREAADKLRRLVARLNEPVVSLSGEYRRNMRQADLMPIIRRVLAANVEPYSALYQIETSLPDELISTVEPERIENVVENLVINAVEAMGARGGRLTVEAGRQSDNYVFFSVADTGVGMSKEFVRTRLFHPFSTTKSKGIGLGLYAVREIVEAHGGRIDVETEVGAGTRFRVVLPSRLFSSGERP